MTPVCSSQCPVNAFTDIDLRIGVENRIYHHLSHFEIVGEKRTLPLSANLSQQGGRGFVRAVPAACEFRFGGNEVTAEGFAEDGLRQLIG